MSILDKNISLKDDLVARNNDDGSVVIMRMDESSLFYKIDGIAADVWKGLNKNQNLKEIFAIIKTQYEVEDKQLMSDISNFIQDLESRELINS
jgi:hypothetical protein